MQRLKLVQNKIKEIINKKQLKTVPQIIAVTKTWPMSEIIPLLEMGHSHFGENKIQEAESKWLNIKNKYNNFSLILVTIILFIQICLGILTLVYEVPLSYASLHQTNAVLLLASMLFAYHRLIYK